VTVRDLERRFDYGYWANARLLAVIAQLTPEQFTQNVAGSYGSIRNTLVHVLSAEWGWLDRCGGPPRGPALKADDFPTLESVVNTWRTVETNVRAFLAGLKDADLDRVIEFTLPQIGKRSALLGDLFEHAANHAVHHRGQVALLLRVLGYTPGNIDLLIYDAERRGVGA
jgi:uncharacterized damage-inducible protein DinB